MKINFKALYASSRFSLLSISKNVSSQVNNLLFTASTSWLAIVTCILTSKGSSYFELGKLPAVILFSLMVVRGLNILWRICEKNFRYLSGLIVLLICFVGYSFKNFAPVLFAGQDPGYYSIYARVLSQGEGSQFIRGDYGALIWSSSNIGSRYEIEFYPLLPSLASQLYSLFDLRSLFVLSTLFVICSALEMSNVLSIFHANRHTKIFVLFAFLTIPTTVWLIRTPASEVVSVYFFCLILNSSLRFKNISPWIAILTFTSVGVALLLARCNPLYIALPTILLLARYVKNQGKVIPKLGDLGSLAISQLGMYFVTSEIYKTFQPFAHKNFIAETLAQGIVASLILNTCLALWFFAKNTNYRKNRNTKFSTEREYIRKGSSKRHIHRPASMSIFDKIEKYCFTANRIGIAILLIVSMFTVMLRDKWGYYFIRDFVTEVSASNRYFHSPHNLLICSFGLTLLFIFRFKNIDQSLVFLLSVFLGATIARNIGIMYWYYFTRYWWSEIFVIILIIIGTQIEISRKDEVGKERKKSSIMIWQYLNMSLISSILMVGTNVIYFDSEIVKNVEGGNANNTILEIADWQKEKGAILYVPMETPGYLVSQFIMPLKFGFNIPIYAKSLENIERMRTRSDMSTLILTFKDCGDTNKWKAKVTFQTEIARLNPQNIVSNNWTQSKQSIHVCENVRRLSG